MKNKLRCVFISLIAILFVIGLPEKHVQAQVDEIVWNTPINLSNTPDATSTDPFLLSDPAGYVHLFWAEKMGAGEGNIADSLMYTVWNGNEWAKPVDIFFSSDFNPKAVFPRGIIDNQGKIHLLWMSEPNSPNHSLNYSSVNSWQAGTASAWQRKMILADDLTGQKYSFDIAFQPPSTLHVLYANGTKASDRGVSYIKSVDGGENCSEPVRIYTSVLPDRGVSDVRVLLELPSRIYSSWTEWDSSGNGQVVYFIRSLDGGEIWNEPVQLDVRRGDEYERDWNNMALLDDNSLVSIWEGGWRAYRHAQYSYDGGATWSDPIDTFPWLIGDNGSVEFVKDSAGRLHVFVANRIREGNPNRTGSGLWHSIWERGMRWREPTLAQGDERYVNGMTNPKIAIVGGNKIVAVWYGSFVYEIMAMTGEITSSPEIAPISWNVASETAEPITQQDDNVITVNATSDQVDTYHPGQVQSTRQVKSLNPANYIFIAIFPSIILILIVMVAMKQKRLSR